MVYIKKIKIKTEGESPHIRKKEYKMKMSILTWLTKNHVNYELGGNDTHEFCGLNHRTGTRLIHILKELS